jgi:hypothetical protein
MFCAAIGHMKRALRNTDTSMFIKADLGETGLIDEAHVFDNYKEAFEFGQQNAHNRVELVVRISEQYEFIVDVPADSSPVILESFSNESHCDPGLNDATHLSAA